MNNIRDPAVAAAMNGSPEAGRMVDSAINQTARQFAGDDGHGGDLVWSFLRRPDLSASADPLMDAKRYDKTLKDGRDAAKAYFSPLYYHINTKLRDAGDKAPDLIESIRSRTPEAPAQNPSSFVPDPAKVAAFSADMWHTPEGWLKNDYSDAMNAETFGTHFGDEAAAYLDHYKKMLGPGRSRDSKVDDTISGLMGLLEHSKMPQTMDLFRGVDGDGLRKIEAQLGVPLSSPEAIGREFTDPAFLSTAYHKPTSDQFAGLEPGYNRPDAGAVFHFPDVPEGKPASLMNDSEHEILFPPGRKIRIDDNSGYPHNIKATLYSALIAALAGRSYNHATEQGVL
jgi:hypothetical protein